MFDGKIVPSPSIATRSQGQKLPFACYQRRATVLVQIAWQGGWSLGVSLRRDTRVQIEVKNILSHKIFQIFSKQVFFKFQDYGMSFDKKNFDGKIVPSPSIATRSQRQKLPFACYQRRRNLPVRIAWQGADAWVSHCDTRVQIEVKNILSHKIFQIFSKQVFFKFQDYGMSFGKKKFLTKKNCSKSQYRNEIPKAETPLCMLSEKAESPCSDRMARG